MIGLILSRRFRRRVNVQIATVCIISLLSTTDCQNRFSAYEGYSVEEMEQITGLKLPTSIVRSNLEFYTSGKRVLAPGYYSFLRLLIDETQYREIFKMNSLPFTVDDEDVGLRDFLTVYEGVENSTPPWWKPSEIECRDQREITRQHMTWMFIFGTKNQEESTAYIMVIAGG